MTRTGDEDEKELSKDLMVNGKDELCVYDG
jgi:hypothetical protein